MKGFLAVLSIAGMTAMLTCSCSPATKGKSNGDRRQDSLTASSAPSVNVDSLAAVYDARSAAGNGPNEGDADEDSLLDEYGEPYDDYDLDAVYADDGYGDELTPRIRHATATYYVTDGSSLYGTVRRRVDVDVDVEVNNGRVTSVRFPSSGVYPSGTDLSGGHVENGRAHVTTNYGESYDIRIH